MTYKQGSPLNRAVGLGSPFLPLAGMMSMFDSQQQQHRISHHPDEES